MESKITYKIVAGWLKGSFIKTLESGMHEIVNPDGVKYQWAERTHEDFSCSCIMLGIAEKV